VTVTSARRMAGPEARRYGPRMSVSGSPGTTTIVVMGVSGSGKSTVAATLVDLLGFEFAEGDEFHPPANVEKMRAGIPLDDEDRWPWLRTLAAWIGDHEQAGRSDVVTCSALKRVYRDLLRDGHPSVWFAHVAVDADTLRERLGKRTGHYMPPSLLDSQMATLEPLSVRTCSSILPFNASPTPRSIAPMRAIPIQTDIASMPVGTIHATRSPGLTPCCRKAAAICRDRLPRSLYVKRRPVSASTMPASSTSDN